MENKTLESYEFIEKSLMDSFKVTALQITGYYKNSLMQSKLAYVTGYQQALQDLYGALHVSPEKNQLSVEDMLRFAVQKSKQLLEKMGPVQHHPPPVTENKKTFRIDPYSQFTFTHDRPRSLKELYYDTSPVTTTKKRPHPNELTFMGKLFNFESHQQPPFKRNRLKHEATS
ncbi:hypothetical protein BY458DRAFT_485502 [Sporodiniella umbellata]|nr:hypothetical protein BY458DRAFT_485502 [Sporodiniella umbellata]